MACSLACTLLQQPQSREILAPFPEEPGQTGQWQADGMQPHAPLSQQQEAGDSTTSLSHAPWAPVQGQLSQYGNGPAPAAGSLQASTSAAGTPTRGGDSGDTQAGASPGSASASRPGGSRSRPAWLAPTGALSALSTARQAAGSFLKDVASTVTGGRLPHSCLCPLTLRTLPQQPAHRLLVPPPPPTGAYWARLSPGHALRTAGADLVEEEEAGGRAAQQGQAQPPPGPGQAVGGAHQAGSPYLTAAGHAWGGSPGAGAGGGDREAEVAGLRAEVAQLRAQQAALKAQMLDMGEAGQVRGTGLRATG
jgi:hypothetical protein